MPIQLYNSLVREKQIFEPISPPHVGMYVCGPTVYGHAHLGHAKSYTAFDVVLRWLTYRGYDVTYIQNITDVGHLTEDTQGMADTGEDKILVEARRRKQHPMAVVEHYTYSYFQDMDALNIIRPDISPRASGHIPEQIELIERLIERGHAYEAGGSVYFDISTFERYGKLSGRNVEEMEAGARVAVSGEKRHPADFALWKRADASHVMQWPSPWGRGYPGWHIECSVMSMKYLGESFDIHGGGIENQFPHHECEIAQSEAATGCPFVKYWMHHNMVTINGGQKMGKSLNNYVSLKELFSGKIVDADRAANVSLSKAYDPMVVRHLLLTTHYRSPFDLSDDALRAAESGYNKLRDAVLAVRKALPKGAQTPQARIADAIGPGAAALLKAAESAAKDPAPASASDIPPAAREAINRVRSRFEEVMDDDFNTAAAIASLFDLVKVANTALAESPPPALLAEIDRTFTQLGGDVLGLLPASLSASALGAGGEADVDPLMQLIIELRAKARSTKDFPTADRIRDALTAAGITLEDKPDGTVWKRK